MNKGFTLIELLAVIVILALISGIAIVSVSSFTSQSTTDYFVSLDNNIKLGASNYFANNRSARPSLGEACSKVNLQTLINKKYIDPVIDEKGNNCDFTNSYVYIKRNANNDYEYKTMLLCDDYKSIFSEEDYCVIEEVVTTTISLSAVDSSGLSYVVTNSYANTNWTNKDVTVSFSSSENITKFVITNTENATSYTCNASANTCNYTFNNQGAYQVSSYNNETLVSTRAFNIKIDKISPTFSLENTGNVNIPYGSMNITYNNKVINVVDESGVARTNYSIYKDNSVVVNDTVSGTTIQAANLSSGRYTIKVKVYDRASNESSEVEQSFNISRSIKLIDTSNSSYDEVYNVVDGTNYGYLGTQLPVLTKEGYTFLGWYITSSGGTKVSSTTTVNSSIVTLYARWE